MLVSRISLTATAAATLSIEKARSVKPSSRTVCSKVSMATNWPSRCLISRVLGGLPQMIDEQPEQIGGSQKLDPGALQHPLSQSNQANAKHHRQTDADVQRQTFLFGVAAGPGDRRQSNGVVRRQDELEYHQHRQQGQHLSPLVCALVDVGERGSAVMSIAPA